jgi:inner membrane protein
MDPLTQGVLGAAAPQSAAARKHLVSAGLLGLLAGMAPDLDVLIRSNTDPLLFLEFHRQFTHSLIFIPVGGLICGLVLHRLLGRRRGLKLRQSVLYCTLGYATHALLDTCTTYGTMLWWPFSDTRFAWNTVSVIDPVFTLPILVLVLATALRKKPLFARLALAWAVIYPGIGLVQRDRAVEAGWSLAKQRGHEPVRLEAKPSFGNLLLWKIVYETQARYYVDAVRAGVDIRVYPGDSVAKLVIERDLPWLQPGSQQARDLERFRWFSNGYVARDPAHDFRVIDIRYSIVPNRATGLWSIELSPDAGSAEHVSYLAQRDTSPESLQLFRDMLFNSRPERPKASIATDSMAP